MRLLLNTASPYARLVRVVLVETGLEAETDLHYVDPWQSPDELLTRNPAAKVPVLELDDGTRIIESACVCDYLIEHSGKERLAPARAADCAVRLNVLGLGRAAIDCAFGVVLLGRYPGTDALATRWSNALPRIAASLDDALSRHSQKETVDLADLTLAVAFEYIDFRLPGIVWREANVRLNRQVAALSNRRSLSTTRPRPDDKH